MKFRLFILLASLVILAFACPLISSVTPTIPVVPVIPATLIPATPVPATAEATPSATSSSLTRTNGPYLVYLRDRESSHELVLMDADGKGETVFPFLLNGNVMMPASLSNLVSPDGTWLAFYSGSAGQVFGHVGSDTADLTINLMSLGITSPAGITKVISRLLSADYPANFAQAAGELDGSANTAQGLQNAFINGISRSIAWSPDGLHLAFAGQMDGLSSDLYLYEDAYGTIQRLSSGPQEVQWIGWSPDGKWILDGSSNWAGEGMTYDLYATSLDGNTVRLLLEDSSLQGAPYWLNAQEFLFFQNQNGRGNFGLERINVESGAMDIIWADSFDSLAVNPSANLVVMHSATDGLFLIDLATLQSTKVQFPDPTHDYGAYQDVFDMGSDPERAFLTRDDTRNAPDQEVYFLSTNGALTPAGASADLFSVAPNRTDWIAIQEDIQLFAGGSAQARTFNLPDGTKRGDFQRIIWRPDSSGIFLVSTTSQLYALNLSSGDSALVETSLSTSGLAGLFWIRK